MRTDLSCGQIPLAKSANDSFDFNIFSAERTLSRTLRTIRFISGVPTRAPLATQGNKNGSCDEYPDTQ
jgi:hypothetical protein